MAEVGRYWYNGGSGYWWNCTPTDGTAKVGSYLPNTWGLYDMHGNVSEWCLDWLGASTSSTVAETNPVGPNTGMYRVIRGGDWSSFAGSCRSADRTCGFPDNSYNTDGIGFRVACLP